MFLCKPCLENRAKDANTTLTFLAESRGPCEDCEEIALCADPPSSWLPVPTKNFKLRKKESK